MTQQFIPEEPSEESIATAQSEPLWCYVSFWPRLCASLMDTVLQSAILVFAYFLYAKSSGVKMNLLTHNWITDVGMFVVIVSMWVRYGATPGKMFLKAQVLDAKTGMRLNLKQAVIRYVGYFLAALPLGYGMLCILWHPKRQGWHDRLAGTVVVRPGEWQLDSNGKPVLKG